MINPIHVNTLRRTALAVAVTATLAVAGCAAAPQPPPGAAEVRTKLTRLQSDPNLANRAPAALSEAEAAVRVAEQPLAGDTELANHRVYMADRKVDIAAARAATRYAEEQRVILSQERSRERLDARTREADQARRDAETAQREAAAAGVAAAGVATAAALRNEELQRKIDELQAQTTERGLVLTLGDVLFATGRADLKPGAIGNLDRLVAFLAEYPQLAVEIEGHTDSVGSAASNQLLSERRAASVRSYLLEQGVTARRMTTAGLGESRPVADNETPSGRQQNRRVEIIIENPAQATTVTAP
jgi:outer membrane protein OmpA-like peptidoglycan-associated protein